MLLYIVSLKGLFQSTLPQGERLYIPIRCIAKCLFQSTLPQGERPFTIPMLRSSKSISIHAPTRGATQCPAKSCDTAYISIHAPTRGATNVRTFWNMTFCISIHAPTRGATFLVMISSAVCVYFNPRSHKGSDYADYRPAGRHLHFNPRSHKGSDNHIMICAWDLNGFQSTLPQGERPVGIMPLWGGVVNFNPRSHKGSDHSTPFQPPLFCVFQSTLPQGERLELPVDKQMLVCISIHAPTRGATPFFFLSDFSQCISIHAPTRGATCDENTTKQGCLFQSTLPQGERQQFSPILGLVLR